jgi:hypothetical protein
MLLKNNIFTRFSLMKSNAKLLQLTNPNFKNNIFKLFNPFCFYLQNNLISVQNSVKSMKSFMIDTLLPNLSVFLITTMKRKRIKLKIQKSHKRRRRIRNIKKLNLKKK